jgi:hypothetical protein
MVAFAALLLCRIVHTITSKAFGSSAQVTSTNISFTCTFAMEVQNYSVNMSVKDKDNSIVTSTGMMTKKKGAEGSAGGKPQGTQK